MLVPAASASGRRRALQSVSKQGVGPWPGLNSGSW